MLDIDRSWGYLLVPAILLPTAACTPSVPGADRAATGWQGAELEEGSTLTVRTTAGAVWAGEATLIEEAAIGAVGEITVQRNWRGVHVPRARDDANA